MFRLIELWLNEKSRISSMTQVHAVDRIRRGFRSNMGKLYEPFVKNSTNAVK